jgi:hypothetical protein
MTDQFSPKPQHVYPFGTDDNEVGTIKAASLAAAIEMLELFADGQAAWIRDQDGTRHELPQVNE